jgi:hypothetical protein
MNRMADQQRLLQRQSRKRLWLGATILALILLVPVILAWFVFPLLAQEPFTSLAEIQPDAIQSLQVRLLIRGEIDPELSNQPDIGPYYAAAEDIPRLLAPLKDAVEVPEFPTAQGPLLGEYRILTQENRRGTIRLYWVRDPSHPSGAIPRLRFKIGTHKYEGGTAMAVIAAAADAATRGRKYRQRE